MASSRAERLRSRRAAPAGATTTPAHGDLPRWQRSLLPAMLGADHAGRGDREGVDLKRSLRDWIVDIVLFVGALGIGVGGLWTDHRTTSTPLFVLDAVLTVPAVGALWVRRRHPWAVGLIAIGAAAVSDGASGAALAAMFSAAIYCRQRRVVTLFGFSLVSAAITPALYPGHHSSYAAQNLVLGLLGTIIATVFGAFVRVRRDLVLSLRERARVLQEEQALRVSEARRSERTRIAREMHDVLAHRISLLAVHAGALEFNPDAPPEEIARAAAVIRESARAAQEELREVIGVLRTDPDEPAVVDSDPLEPPQPTLEDLAPLVEESRAAGIEVRLATALDPVVLPPTIGRTVYRVVQEGLTNVHKHAPEQVVTIAVVGGHHGGVRVSVTNQPVVGRAEEGPNPEHVGSGTGLIGLAERVALLGGTLEYGSQPGGGFRLCATLPWQSEIA
ncbi:MAG TPA: histidine kinase [Solirubrobacteraceae bacterium]|nr:histidine kinase [Solirubrobacteraceae bacterium]